VESKKLGQTLFVFIGIAVGVYAALAILMNPTGGIAGLSKLITILGFVIGVVNPRMGLFFLCAQSIYADEIKRIGVYYGVASTQTVSEILIGPLLTLGAINLSFLYGIVQRRYHLNTLGWVLYALIPCFAIAMLVGGGLDEVSLKLYLAGTASLYMTLVPVCYGLFKSMEDWVSFVSWQVVLAAPAAAWGISQYYNGFNDIEWTYALSGLSRVHSQQMLLFAEPRIFGLFGSASAFGCVSLYGTFAFWRAFRYRKMRLLFLGIGILYFVTLVYSQQRTALVYPLIVLLFTFGFRTRLRTFTLYAVGGTVLLTGILGSGYLLETGLDRINQAIAVQSNWGDKVLNVSTFSDRLRGWERLTHAESWSLFGTSTGEDEDGEPLTLDSKDFNHDAINKILIKYGAVGLVIALAAGGFVIFRLHQLVFSCKDLVLKRDGAFALASIVPGLYLSMVGGDNLTTTPVNLQTWAIFAGVFLIRKLDSRYAADAGNLPQPTASPAMPVAGGASRQPV
jgi:hypothetical protein